MMDYVNAFVSMLNGMSPYLLLGFFIAGVLHAFVPSAIYSRYLAGTGLRSVATAAAFGIPLPLCSCGVLPTAVALRRSGASRAASTSFLIATPQTGVDSIAATYSMMGLPFAILRPVAALVTSLIGGLAVGHWERKGALDDDVAVDANYEFSELPRGFWNKVLETFKYGFFDMMQSIGRWLLIGLVVATLITVLLPDDFFSTYARWPLLNMFIIVLVAVPMYVCATGSIPIAAALMLKGMSPGCALVLLMAGPAANMASMFVVNNAFGRKATIVYLLSIIGGAIGFGVLVDYLPGLRELFVNALPVHAMHHGMHSASWLNTICSIALLAMILVAMGAKYWKSYQIKQNKTTAMKEFKVKGMMCAHCKANVEKGLAALPGVEKVTVDLAKGTALVEGLVPDQLIIDCIEDLGYQYEP